MHTPPPVHHVCSVYAIYRVCVNLMIPWIGRHLDELEELSQFDLVHQKHLLYKINHVILCLLFIFDVLCVALKV